MTLAEDILIGKFIVQILPGVEKELKCYHKILEKCPSHFLRSQALASLKHKRFHAQGGGFFQLYGSHKKDILPALVALQTISDYLDNLCDRTDIFSMQAFKTLHLSMEKAICADKSCHNSYLFYPFQNDGGYLEYLEKRCSSCLSALPSYKLVQNDILRLVKLYSQLQVAKHIAPREREPMLYSWFLLHRRSLPELYWWEFAAATGSTLGIFILMAAARNPKLTEQEVQSLLKAYFPWICGLHILLDYLIDQEEDYREGDLNFTTYYSDNKMTKKRLLFFLTRSLEAVKSLPHPSFHRAAIKGMLALYLSDPKVKEQGMEGLAFSLLKSAGIKTVAMRRLCSALRRYHLI